MSRDCHRVSSDQRLASEGIPSGPVSGLEKPYLGVVPIEQCAQFFDSSRNVESLGSHTPEFYNGEIEMGEESSP